MDSVDTHTRVELALEQAKKVRRESNTLVQQLAQLRDHLQPKEAQEHEQRDRHPQD